MINTKNTKRALLSSVIALLVCISMLIGTTFAWFTDSVTSGRNQIVAGNLDVELYYSVLDDDGNWTEYAKVGSDTKVFKDGALYEPGYTEVVKLKVVNEGTLALKYKIHANIVSETPGINVYGKEFFLSDSLLCGVVSKRWQSTIFDQLNDRTVAVAQADNKLSEAIDISGVNGAFVGGLGSLIDTGNINIELLPGAESESAMILTMPTTVGNEANYLTSDDPANPTKNQPSIELGITLIAAQQTSESDSFNDQYDKFADYDGEISTGAALTAAFANGGTYKLIKNITLDSTATVPAGKSVNLDLGGKSITAKTTAVINEGTITIANGKIENTKENGATVIDNKGTMTLDGAIIVGAPFVGEGYPEYAVTTSGKLTVEDGTSITADFGAIAMTNGADVIINGGEIKVTDAADTSILTTHVIDAKGNDSKLTIYDGNFALNYNSDAGVSVISPRGATIKVYGGNFTYAGEKGGQSGVFQNYMGYGDYIDVYGGTYNDTTVNGVEYQHHFPIADGYIAVDNGDGTYTVVKGVLVSTADEIKNAVEAGQTNIYLKNGEYDMPNFDGGSVNGVKFIGQGSNTVIKLYNVNDTAGDFCLSGSTATFEKVKIVTEIKDWSGFQNAQNLTFNKCEFENNLFLSGNATFNECHFVVTTNHYNVWAATRQENYTAEFNDCVFDCAGKSIYIDGNPGKSITMKFDGCTFNDNDGGATDKAAIETGTAYGAGATYNVIITGCEFNGFAAGKNTDSTIWANKNSMTADKLNVTINDKEVY